MPDSEKLQDKDGSHWERIDSKIPRTLRHAMVRILGLFSGLPLRWQLVCAVGGLTLASFCGYYLQRILSNSQANLSRAMAATMVSTAYPHRGVTAFLVGELDKNLPSSAKEDPTLKTAVEAIAQDINSLSNSNFDEQTLKKVLDNLDFEVRDKPNLGHPTDDLGHTWTKIIQSKEMEHDKAFLMVPAISVRQSTVKKNVLQDKVKLKEVLRLNPEIVFDFYVAKQIDEKLKLLGKPPAAHPLEIVQAYFISESGVILLRQLTTDKLYENTFPPNTLFMDRLYFWGAINPDEFSRPKYEGGPLKFATEPYVDLGGNGVVITFSQRVELPNMRNGVICVDVALPIGTETEIEKRLKDLEAVVLPNTFISEERRFENTLPPEFKWLNPPSVDGPTSRITGAIAFESDFLKKGVISSDDQVVRFTVPITSEVRFNGSNKTTATKLLLVTFDFRSTRKWIFWSSIGFAAGIGLFMVVAANLLWKFVDLGRQMDRVLEKMSTVMYDATTPFIWLNENNEFVKVNVSFLHAIGCDTEHELLQHASKFRDLVTAESAPDYDEILQLSLRGKPTPKYQIQIKKVNGEKISVWVHGEGVPSARLGRNVPRTGSAFSYLSQSPIMHHPSDSDLGDVTHERDSPTSSG